jgi:hypothetical protein
MPSFRAAIVGLAMSCIAVAIPNKLELRRVFVDGNGTLVAGFLEQAQIDTIDRDLKITYSLPELNMNSGMPYPFNETCGATSLSCPAMQFDITPGMDVTTAMVRGFAGTDSTSADTAIAPTYSWAVVAGKKYTLLMVDNFSPNPAWAAFGVPRLLHYGVFNIEGNDISTGTATSAYGPPGTPFTEHPNVYAFLIFEHDAAIDATAAVTAAQTPLSNMSFFLNSAGLGSAKLVAMNFFRAYGNQYSLVHLRKRGLASFASTIPCSSYTSTQMCFNVDEYTTSMLMTTTTAAGVASSPTSTTLQVPTSTTPQELAPTTPQALATSTGSFSVSVDATATQVKSSTENAMGKLLHDQGVGNSSTEAAGFVNAVVTTSTTRRLSWHSRRLAITQYDVAWTIAVPVVSAGSAQTTVNNLIANASTLQNEMVTQFQAAGVTSASQVTISSFVVVTSFTGGLGDSSLAARTTSGLSAALMTLTCVLSWMA